MMEHPNRRRAWPIEQIATWIAEGQTHRWIGEQLGCADQRISKLCQKHGIAVRPRGPRPGPGNSQWKGGRVLDKDGYWLVWHPDHPHARNRKTHGAGYVLEHRLVMEQQIGRYLEPSEVVHHRNNDNGDNRPENLELFATNGEHLRHELTGKCPKWSPEGRERILAANRAKGKRAAPPAEAGPPDTTPGQ